MTKYLTLMAVALFLTACGQQKSSEAEESHSAAIKESDTSGEIMVSGEFSGRSDHVTTGGVDIMKSEDGYYVVLNEDFSLDGAPDPMLGFGNGDYMIETQFSELLNDKGHQTYKLPDGFDPMEYSEIYVWCEKFSVPLGVASLQQ